MKKLILAAITVSTAASVFAQGTVVFNNRVTGLGTTRVYSAAPGLPALQGNTAGDIPAGSTVYGAGYTLIGTTGGMTASTTFTQLIGAPGAGAPESSLLPGAGVTTFRTGAGAGNVAGITSTFANIPKDAASATFEMVAWDNSSGLYPTWTQAAAAAAQGVPLAVGHSSAFTLNSIGGDVNTPPNILPFVTSFSIGIVPEPTTAALLGLGAAGMLIFRRRK